MLVFGIIYFLPARAFFMRKLVLSLQRREDRRKHFIENTNLTDWEFFDAIDGSLYDFERLQAEGFSTFKAYRDPGLNRKMTKGEIGCYLSHRALWHKCLELNEPILILEDDAIQQTDYDKEYYETLVEEYDFIYLNRKEMQEDKVTSINNKLELPSYPYNLTAYIITPKAAKLLLRTGRDQHIIPVDEYVILCLPYLKHCALKNDLFKPAPRRVVTSDVENVFNDTNMWFIDFNVYNISYINNLELFKRTIEGLDDDDVVFYSDKKVSIQDLTTNYLNYRCKVIFGDDNRCVGVVKEIKKILETYGTKGNIFKKAFESNTYSLIFGPNLC